MDIALTIIAFIALISIVWALLKFALRATARLIGCVVTILIAMAIVIIALVTYL